MKFDHVALISEDIEASIAWYEDNVTDVITLYKDDTWALINAAGQRIAFVSPNQHPAHICFLIEDSDAEDIKKRFPGKKFKKHRDGTSSFYTRDPDGNIIEYLIDQDDRQT